MFIAINDIIGEVFFNRNTDVKIDPFQKKKTKPKNPQFLKLRIINKERNKKKKPNLNIYCDDI